MVKNIKEIIIIISCIIAVVASALLFNMKETEKKNRVKNEEQLEAEKVLKKRANKELSLATEDRDYLKDDLEKKRQQAQALESELLGSKREIESTRRKITDVDNKIAYNQKRLEEIRAAVDSLKIRIADAVKDTSKVSEELKMLISTRDALKERLAQMLKEKAKPEEVQTQEFSPEGLQPFTKTSAEPKLIGEVLTINREFDFVVVNLGRVDGVKEGVIIDICRDNNKLGKAQVETVRENISAAALIDKENISKMKPGDKALLY